MHNYFGKIASESLINKNLLYTISYLAQLMR